MPLRDPERLDQEEELRLLLPIDGPEDEALRDVLQLEGDFVRGDSAERIEEEPTIEADGERIPLILHRHALLGATDVRGLHGDPTAPLRHGEDDAVLGLL